MSNRVVAHLLSFCLITGLAGCGGGSIGSGDTSSSSSGGTSTSSSSSGSGSSSGTVVTPIYSLGFVDDSGAFQAGKVFVGQTPLAAGGSTGVRVEIADTANGNALFTDPTAVTFTSSCVGRGLSKINPSPATSASGSASATYVAQGCSGNDVITASATVGTTVVTASGTVMVQPSAIGGIEFVSATPTTIGLRGSGQTETSTVVFRVLNASGGPVPQQDVTFSLNTTNGGITLSPATGKTDDTGTVQTVVRSGSTHTAVRVTATTTDSTNSATLSSQSEQLTITTGIPDQDSFSLAVSCNNVSALDIDGTPVTVTLRGADRYNNPVPDGTAVSFTTEGGSIVGSCLTGSKNTDASTNTVGFQGGCSVQWTGQDPRPQSYGSDDNGPRAGRSTILATAIGEESYVDADGDGLFDSSEAFGDLPEPFVDLNGDRVRQSFEPFIDFNSNGVYDGPDGRYNGLLCDAGGNTITQCAAPRTTFVRASNLIIMASDSPEVSYSDDVSVDMSSGATYDAATRTIRIPAGGSTTVRIVVRDRNDEPMPNGATIAATLSDSGSTVGTNSFKVPCTTDDSVAGNSYNFGIKANMAPTPPANVSGRLEIMVTSNGLITVIPFTVISVAQ